MNQVVIPNTTEPIVYVRLMPYNPTMGFTVQRHVISAVGGGKGDLFEAGKWYSKPRAFGEHAERYQRQDPNNPASPRLFQICWTRAEWENVVRTERRRALGLDKLSQSSEKARFTEAPPVPSLAGAVVDPTGVDLRLPEEKPQTKLFDETDNSLDVSAILDEPGRGDLTTSDLPKNKRNVAPPVPTDPEPSSKKTAAPKSGLVGQRKPPKK